MSESVRLRCPDYSSGICTKNGCNGFLVRPRWTGTAEDGADLYSGACPTNDGVGYFNNVRAFIDPSEPIDFDDAVQRLYQQELAERKQKWLAIRDALIDYGLTIPIEEWPVPKKWNDKNVEFVFQHLREQIKHSLDQICNKDSVMRPDDHWEELIPLILSLDLDCHAYSIMQEHGDGIYKTVTLADGETLNISRNSNNEHISYMPLDMCKEELDAYIDAGIDVSRQINSESNRNWRKAKHLYHDHRHELPDSCVFLNELAGLVRDARVDLLLDLEDGSPSFDGMKVEEKNELSFQQALKKYITDAILIFDGSGQSHFQGDRILRFLKSFGAEPDLVWSDAEPFSTDDLECIREALVAGAAICYDVFDYDEVKGLFRSGATCRNCDESNLVNDIVSAVCHFFENAAIVAQKVGSSTRNEWSDSLGVIKLNCYGKSEDRCSREQAGSVTDCIEENFNKLAADVSIWLAGKDKEGPHGGAELPHSPDEIIHRLFEKDSREEVARLDQIKELFDENWFFIVREDDDVESKPDGFIYYESLARALEDDIERIGKGEVRTPISCSAWQYILPAALSFPSDEAIYRVIGDDEMDSTSVTYKLANGKTVRVGYELRPHPLQEYLNRVRTLTSDYLVAALKFAQGINSKSKEMWVDALGCYNRVKHAFAMPQSRPLLNRMVEAMIDAVTRLEIDIKFAPTEVAPVPAYITGISKEGGKALRSEMKDKGGRTVQPKGAVKKLTQKEVAELFGPPCNADMVGNWEAYENSKGERGAMPPCAKYNGKLYAYSQDLRIDPSKENKAKLAVLVEEYRKTQGVKDGIKKFTHFKSEESLARAAGRVGTGSRNP